MSQVNPLNSQQERLLQVIKRPHISEKATIAAEKNRQFVFEVCREATKTEVKNAVELLFDVKVDAVNITNVQGKTRRFRQKEGLRKSWKKAYVALKEGYDINFAGTK